jgi:hypothetical protein
MHTTLLNQATIPQSYDSSVSAYSPSVAWRSATQLDELYMMLQVVIMLVHSTPAESNCNGTEPYVEL